MKEQFPEELALRYRKKNYKGKYGISLGIFNEMLSAQNGVCAICSKTDDPHHLAVDHCHKTGRVRKLLCKRCNLTVEYIENAQEDISKYLSYIREFQ